MKTKKPKPSEPDLAQIDVAKLLYEFGKKIKAIEDKHRVTLEVRTTYNCKAEPRVKPKSKPVNPEPEEDEY